MKVKEIDASIEKQICTYSIVSTKLLTEISPILKIEYFESTYVQIVMRWVLEYFREYKKAPGKHIQDLYHKNSSQIRDEDDIELISDFLLRLSNKYVEGEKENTEFLVKNALTYLKLQAVKKLKDKLDLCILNKDAAKAENEIATFQRIDSVQNKGVSILDDTIKVATAFLEEEDTLFSFPGVLGREVGTFSRGDLVAYMAAAKRGKSWWEWYTAQIAAYYGYRVLFFNLEMTDVQVIRRAWVSLTGTPRRKKENQIKRTIEVPFFKETDDEELWEVETEEREYDTIDLTKIAMKQKSFRRQFRSGSVRIFSLPAYSATLEDIQAIVDNLFYYEQFIPDVIVIDYADLILPSKRGGSSEYRHQLDVIWKGLRKLAQEKNALVVTASQSGRAAFDADGTEKDIAEDIRKVAHVSKLISINQTKAEREIGVVRLQQLVERDDRIGGRKVVVLQCLDLGQVCIDSKLQKEVSLPSDMKK